MVFGFKAKERMATHPLTEEEIRNRLYGSAVGISADAQERILAKRPGANYAKSLSQEQESEDGSSKIKEELQALKRELNQTKKRLKKQKGLQAKKMGLLALSLTIFLILIMYFFIFLKLK